MADITILPLFVPDEMGARALGLLFHAQNLFLQTEKHPYARAVRHGDKPYVSMDDLYAEAADFDALNSAIAARLVEKTPSVYAVTGNIKETQLPAIERAAQERGLSVSVMPGVPAGEAAFPGRPAARAVTAASAQGTFDPTLPLVVEEIDSAMAAGGVKLALMEYWPDDWEIEFAEMDDAGAYHTRSIPLFELDRQARYGAASAAYIKAAAFSDLKRYGYEQLLSVMRRLRAPGGCPWDREQTHGSLKAPLLEECYELLDALDEGDDAHICEELGDVLLQFVFHCEIAAEQARFTERDAVSGLVEKLVYRHPHIFGTASVSGADDVADKWEQLKNKEKGRQTFASTLTSVPRSLPSLTFARKVQKRAAGAGFDWDCAENALFKIGEEAEELKEAMAGGGDVSEEMGDLLFAAVNVARLLHLDPELLLRAATDKFIRRFSDMEALAASEGKRLENLTLEDMDTYWERVKKSENRQLFTK